MFTAGRVVLVWGQLRAVATLTKITGGGKNFIIAYSMSFSVLM